jgi:methionyl-tRNA formyltransferase
VKEIMAGRVKPLPQAKGLDNVRVAPKLTPANCRIDWSQTAQRVHDHIRGLSPFPGAWSTLVIDEGPPQHFKIARSRVAYHTPDGGPGTVVQNEQQLLVRCAAGAIEALEVQAEGKRRMDTASFLRGLRGERKLRFT